MMSKEMFRGVLCGLFVSLFFLSGDGFAQVEKPLILDMVHNNPGEAPYDSRYVDPAVIKKMGYNGKVYFLFESPTLAINWESLDPDILPKGSKERAWVDAKAVEIKKMHAACRAQGITIFSQADMVLFPKRLIEKYGIQNTFGDPRDPQTDKFLRIQIAEMFDQFPDLDGLAVRIGETYMDDAPFHKGKILNKKNADKTIIPLIQLLREEICVKRNKQLLFRTWLSFATDTKNYQKVSDAIEPHPNMVFSMKFCEGDFHRANSFSRIIGMGQHRQIIEVQCAREYEGKGAYPNYIAHGVIEGFEEYDRQPKDQINSLRAFTEKKPELFGGVWTWTRGGGWGGPYITNEMWCDLNAWVMAQWANDPSKSEESIFKRYAKERMRLKGRDVPAFRKLALLSADAVVRGRNSTHRDMNPWWTRDMGIGWPGVCKLPEAQARNLKQKDESIKMWEEIARLSKSIKWPNKETRNYAVASSQYGLRLYTIYRSLIYLADAEANQDETAMKKWIEVYDDAWVSYKKLLEEFPDVVATLYTQEYRRHIRNRADAKVDKLRGEL